MFKSRLLSFILVLLFYSSTIRAQNEIIDSLLNELNLSKPDTTKANILNQLSKEHRSVNAEEGRSYAQEALRFSDSINYSKGKGDAYYYSATYNHDDGHYQEAIAQLILSIREHYSAKSFKDVVYSYFELGNVHENLVNFDSAHYFYEVAFNLSDSLNNNLLRAHSSYYIGEILHLKGKNKLALHYALKAHNYYRSQYLEKDDWYTLNILSNIHSEMGMYAESLKFNLLALEIAQKLHDKNGEIIIQNNIAILYNHVQNNELASNYYQEAYETAKIIGDIDMEATLLGNLAGLKAELGDTITALLYTKKALSIQLENEMTCELPYSYEGLGDIFIGQNILDSAVYYLDKALAIAIDCGDLGIVISLKRNLGIAFRKQKKYNQAEEFLKESLMLSKNALMKNEERESAFELYKLQKVLNKDKSALKYHEYFQSLSDSIFNLENSERVNQLTTEYAFKKEKKLIELENEKQILEREAQLENQTLIRNTALLMLFFTIVFLIMLYQSNLYIKLQNSRLKALNNEKNTLMGIVAHDLRNPLNNIKTIIPIMKDDSPEAKESMEELVDMIGETTDRMYSMIDRILDVNAVEEMKIKLNLSVLDIGIIVNDVFNSFQIPADQKGIKMQYELKEGEHFAKLDKNYLVQILENLISNAIKFSPSNTKISLSIINDNGFEEIVVADEGPGISGKEQEKLFTRFSKLSNTPTAGESSTGLGLSIVKKYVEVMGGKIICDSKKGEGSTFRVIFKRAKNS